MNQRLKEIKERIKSKGEIKKAKKFFAGAGLVIRDQPRDSIISSNEAYTTVYTKYASELSALVEELRGAMKGRIDYLNKYDFYPLQMDMKEFIRIVIDKAT